MICGNRRMTLITEEFKSGNILAYLPHDRGSDKNANIATSLKRQNKR